ncbi:MAG: G-D-S-L family lipolytic protein [Flavobacteriaceae bacterium]|jgi:lysophospholipase L1-like esterase|nr:G-D-S-L family lipolytic protein [Flavobacteriaceae bacterium]
MKKYIIPALVSFLVVNISCNNDFDDKVSDVVVQSGQADFSRYVALGNSLTSGFRDNALYIAGQQESYPVMLAGQMKHAGGGDFKVPYMADELGGIPAANVENKKILAVVNGSLSPVTLTGTGTTTLANIYSQGPYQNLGIPGAKSFHLIAKGYGDPANLATGKANPYFIRFASGTDTTVLADALSQNPTFFSLWIGNNDVLGYATTGGDGSDPITDVATFSSAYTALLQGLTSNGAKGVVADLPNVTNIPFFTTIPYKAISPKSLTDTNPNQIEELNAAFAPLNQVFTDLGYPERKIVYSATQANPVLIKDKGLTDLKADIIAALVSKGMSPQQATLYGSLYGQSRQTVSSDLLLLTLRDFLGKPNQDAINSGIPATLAVNGVTYPLEDKWVLTAAETKNINDATIAFNTIIKDLANKYDLAFANINSLVIKLNGLSGILYDGVNYTSTFVTGGTFSLDGVHLTGRGYAFVANEFIRSINQKYGSNLPLVNPNTYQGVSFP